MMVSMLVDGEHTTFSVDYNDTLLNPPRGVLALAAATKLAEVVTWVGPLERCDGREPCELLRWPAHAARDLEAAFDRHRAHPPLVLQAVVDTHPPGDETGGLASWQWVPAREEYLHGDFRWLRSLCRSFAPSTVLHAVRSLGPLALDTAWRMGGYTGLTALVRAVNADCHAPR
jgi:hypothetical protein